MKLDNMDHATMNQDKQQIPIESSRQREAQCASQ